MYYINYSNMYDLKNTCDYIETLNKKTNLIRSISELTESFYLRCLHTMYLNKKSSIYLVFDEEEKDIYIPCEYDSITQPERIKDNDIYSFLREFFGNIWNCKKRQLLCVIIDKKNKKIEICEKKSTNIFTPDVIKGDDTIYNDRKKYYY